MRRDWIAFVGPTLPAREAAAFGCQVRPPARQGDVWRAIVERPRALVVIDGVFESVPSVWPHELRAALASGIAVFGAASLGALRAVELASEGMIGLGEIFRSYRDGLRIDDADVALLHAGAEHGYRPITVPWVNAEHALRRAVTEKVVNRTEAAKALQAARSLHYQQRFWPQVFAGAGWSPEVSARFEQWRRAANPDLKAADARECLAAASAWVKSGAPAPALRSIPESSFVRRQRLVDARPGVLAKLARGADAEALANAGLRRRLLSGWARSMGVEPEPRKVAAWLAKVPLGGIADDERVRIAEDCALEEQLLDSPQAWLADGPTRAEGLADEAKRLGRWKK